MNGEGFAFACWVRLKVATGEWLSGDHGWNCPLCRRDWIRLRSVGKSEGVSK